MPVTVPTDHPTNLASGIHNSTSFTLSWDPPPPEHHNGEIREYRVNVTETLTGRVLQFSTSSTRLVVTGLRPYTEYECVVVAVTVDEGPHSSAIIVRTREDGKKRIDSFYEEQLFIYVQFSQHHLLLHRMSR